jgi:hypothetical protein
MRSVEDFRTKLDCYLAVVNGGLGALTTIDVHPTPFDFLAGHEVVIAEFPDTLIEVLLNAEGRDCFTYLDHIETIRGSLQEAQNLMVKRSQPLLRP